MSEPIKINDIKINCKFDNLVTIGELKNNPKNPNRHSDEQIKRLAKLFEYQGVRHPVIESKRSGLIVAGHGRLEAMKLCGMDKAPVVYQDFDDEAQEYAFMVSDNSIQMDFADLDLSMIKIDAYETLGTFDFDMDLLGLKNFSILPSNDFSGVLEDQPEKKKTNEPKCCPSCGYQF